MKIGVAFYSFNQAFQEKRTDVFQAIRFLAENGAEHIELSTPAGFSVHGIEKEIVRCAADHNLELSSYTIGANFVQDSPEKLRAEIDRIKKEVDTGFELGVHRMRHDAGWLPQEQCGYDSFEQYLPVFADACREIADHAAAGGITTSVENHGFLVQNSDRVRRLVRLVDRPNFRTTLDVGNFLCADEDPLSGVMNNISIASMVHFKDFYIRQSPVLTDGYIRTLHGKFIRGAAIGDGDVDIPAIADVIRKSTYDGYISVEFEGQEDSFLGIRRGLNVLKKLFGKA